MLPRVSPHSSVKTIRHEGGLKQNCSNIGQLGVIKMIDSGRVLIAVPSTGSRSTLRTCIESLLAEWKRVGQCRDEVAITVFLNNREVGAISQLDSSQIQVVDVKAQGFADVRNAILSYTQEKGFDYVLFFDDDQIACEGWLEAFLFARDLKVDVALGPVNAIFPPTAPRWAKLNPELFRYDLSSRASGHFDGHVYSGNTMLRIESTALRRLSFDSRLNQGGEDTYFFHCLRRTGGRFYWVSEARALELQEDERTTIYGFLHRNYWKGRTAYALESMGVFADRLPASLRHTLRVLRSLTRVAVAPIRPATAYLKLFQAAADLAFVCGVCAAALPRHCEATGEAINTGNPRCVRSLFANPWVIGTRRNTLRPKLPSYYVCGVRIAALRPSEAVSTLIQAARAHRPTQVHLCNSYTLSLVDTDPELQKALQCADLNLPDGAPVSWLGWRYGTRGPVRGPTLVGNVVDAGRKVGLKHYLYGGTEGVAEAMKNRVMINFPGAQIVGAETPPYRDLSDNEVNQLGDRIVSSDADIVWIGLGTPRQDYLVPRLSVHVNATLVPIGAAFDFWSGRVRQAPLVLQGKGLEWLYRLAIEPRRLWRRYLFGNPRFVISAIKHWVNHVVRSA